MSIKKTNAAIAEEFASHVLRFRATIESNEALVSAQAIFCAMPPDRHPAARQTIDLKLISAAHRDDEPELRDLQRRNLRPLLIERIGGRIERQEIRLFSVFGLAPQPLPIELGRLLYDIIAATVHQPLRSRRRGNGNAIVRPPVRCLRTATGQVGFCGP